MSILMIVALAFIFFMVAAIVVAVCLLMKNKR